MAPVPGDRRHSMMHGVVKTAWFAASLLSILACNGRDDDGYVLTADSPERLYDNRGAVRVRITCATDEKGCEGSRCVIAEWKMDDDVVTSGKNCGTGKLLDANE